MRPAETIIDEIIDMLNDAEKLQDSIKELVGELKKAPQNEWDWISVKKASLLLDVSVGAIYAKINSGKLTTKHIGAKTFVKLSEVMAIDDK